MSRRTGNSRRERRPAGGGPAALLALLLLLAHLAAVIGAAAAAPARRSPVPPLVRIRSVDPTIVIDLRYRSADNTFKRRLYNSNVALLREPVARRLARVQRRLKKVGLGLKVWDAYRPSSVQWTMWQIRPNPRYLARPWKGSKHSRGAAVDVTLVRLRDGRELPMPTPHDEFSPRAHRGATRGTTPLRRKNAAILDRAMRAEGFLPNRYEWWHFDDPLARRYPLADTPLPR